MARPFSGATGQVGSVIGNVVSGWIFGAYTPEVKDIQLLVNGRKLIPAEVFISPGGGPPNRWQFDIYLSDPVAVGDIISISVKICRVSRGLAGSPWVVRDAPKTNFEYAFLHVPKTAGTSLRLSLEKALGASAVFPSQGYLTSRGAGYPSYAEYKALSYGLGDELRLIQGHLGLDEIKELAPRARVIAVFREPIERVLSLIKHRLASLGDQDASEKDIADRFLVRGDGGFSNGQVRALIGKLDLGEGVEQAAELATAKLTDIDFLGTSENYAGLLEQLSEVIGASMRNDRLNTTRMPDRQFSEAFVERVRELNQLDISFYKNVSREVSMRAAH